MRYNILTKAGVALLFVAAIGFPNTSSAQTTDVGEPYGWQSKTQLEIEKVTLPKVDIDQLKSEDAINMANKVGPFRFGHEHIVNLDVIQSATITSTAEGEVYQVEFISKDALTMNVFFQEFDLGPGEYVHVFDSEGKFYDGAYTAANNQPDLLLSTLPIPATKIVVEYFRPSDSTYDSKLTIGHVVQGYRQVAQHFVDALHGTAKGLNDSGSCNYDTGCSQLPGNPFGAPGEWDDPIASVAIILINGSGICSGALVNNTANDGTPYFLSANHCGTSGGGGRSFLFGYESATTSCATTANSSNGPTTAQISGATLRASNSASDVALWELNSTIPNSYNVYFAGWDNSGNIPNEITGIHHPSGDVKKICREEDSPFYDTAGGAQVWWINEWEWGVTEPGSSGSPIFDQNKRIVGQLYGGLAACSGTVNNGTYDYYGRFDVSWDNGSSSSSRLSDWLDPLGLNPTTLDGYNPNQPSANLDAAVQSVDGVSGFFCNQEIFNPSVQISNAGVNTLTSLTIAYSLNGSSLGSIEWTGSLVSGSNESVSLPVLNISESGLYDYEVTVSNPNGGSDENASNNSGVSSLEAAIDANSAQLDLTFDCWPNEVSWELVSDATGNVLATGDGYPGDADGTTVSEIFCLAEGCYTFTIFDSFGDGMSGASYTSCGFDGDYQILDDDGTVLVEMTAPGADYGDFATHSFCIDGGTVPCAQPYPVAQNLTTTTQINGVLLQWDPIPGSIGCQIQGGLASASGLASFTTFQPNASSFLAPSSQLQNGQQYRWRVRCGCTTSIIGAWSDFDFFNWNVATKNYADLSDSMTLFPNPANNEMTVKLDSGNSGVYIATFYDLQGRMVKEEQHVIDGTQMLRYDISDLDAGVYLFQVSNGISTFSEKLIKQ
ncbi:T9SS type A sorting domain-containing protein [Cryomorphaceae bacterium 1068]|nr:T9SS type A sorting domain-containing protein [Cryomorphaceae bacterium 1068]